MKPKPYPALFLDRDGVIIENRPDYVRSWADVSLFPQAIAALVELASAPCKIVIVTNQSGINRGLIPRPIADGINRQLVELIEQAGGRIDGVFMCPHLPQENCDCRKPRPGLLRQAAQALAIELSQSVMIGDALTDVQAGQAAGVAHSALIRTGRGAAQLQLPAAATLPSFPVYDTLADALAELVVRF